MEIWARGALKKCLGATVPCPSAWEGSTPLSGAAAWEGDGQQHATARWIALAVSCSLKAMGCLAWPQDAIHYTGRKFFSHFGNILYLAIAVVVSLGYVCLYLSMCKHGQTCTCVAPHASDLVWDLSPCCLAWCSPSPWARGALSRWVHPKFSAGNASVSQGMARSWHPSWMTSAQPLSPSEAMFHHSWGNGLDPFLTLSEKFPRLHTLKKKSLIQKTKGGVI